jgi:hypothetical protein
LFELCVCNGEEGKGLAVDRDRAHSTTTTTNTHNNTSCSWNLANSRRLDHNELLSKGKRAISSVGELQQPTATNGSNNGHIRKEAPLVLDYIHAWTDTKETDQELATAGSLFGAKYSWFIREQYVALHDQIAARSANGGHSILEIIERICWYWKVVVLAVRFDPSSIDRKMFPLGIITRTVKRKPLQSFYHQTGPPSRRSCRSYESEHHEQFTQWYAQVS